MRTCCLDMLPASTTSWRLENRVLVVVVNRPFSDICDKHNKQAEGVRLCIDTRQQAAKRRRTKKAEVRFGPRPPTPTRPPVSLRGGFAENLVDWFDPHKACHVTQVATKPLLLPALSTYMRRDLLTQL